MDVSSELKYLYKTDQADRRKIIAKVLFQSQEKYASDEKIMAVSNRDSIRLNRVMELDKNNLLNSDLDKYHAGFIYLHGGGSKMRDDIAYLNRSSELFRDLMTNAGTKKMQRRGKTYYQESQAQLDWLKSQ